MICLLDAGFDRGSCAHSLSQNDGRRDLAWASSWAARMRLSRERSTTAHERRKRNEPGWTTAGSGPGPWPGRWSGLTRCAPGKVSSLGCEALVAG